MEKGLHSVPKADAVSALKGDLQLFVRHAKTAWAKHFISVMNAVDETAFKFIFKIVTRRKKITI